MSNLRQRREESWSRSSDCDGGQRGQRRGTAALRPWKFRGCVFYPADL